MTGATGSLGPSLVEAFLALGAEVLATGRRRTALDALRADMRHHERLEVAECDIGDPEGAEKLFDAWTRQGRADVVVHAAGAHAEGALEDHDDDTLRRLVEGNVLTAAVVLRAALRRMRPQKSGSVVMIASSRGDARGEDGALHGATEAAVRRLVADTPGRGVRVNAVLPRRVDDDETQRAVVRAAVWLASEASQGIHGSWVRAC